MERLEKITKEDYFMTREEALEWADWIENTIYSKGKKEGKLEGKLEGIKEGIEQNIKTMFDNGIEIDVISKVTGKDIEEIKDIIEKEIN